jgi:hypothetical protein
VQRRLLDAAGLQRRDDAHKLTSYQADWRAYFTRSLNSWYNTSCLLDSGTGRPSMNK